MKNLLLYLLLAVALAGCKKNLEDPVSTLSEQTVRDTSTVIRFYLESKNNKGKIDSAGLELTMRGDSVIGVAPGISDEKSFVLSFEPATANVKVGGVAQKSGVTVNDFSKPVIYTYTNSKGEVRNLKVIITNFTGLPIFYLTTASPVVSEDDYVTGSLNVNVNGQFDQPSSNMSLNIKGRGNSTWLAPKKPYRIKFNSKQSLLGLTSAKNWVLLANYYDKSLLRNAVAFDIGHQFSADFTPDYRFVEVVMNGVYVGNYMLTEQVEINPGRVDITEMSSNSDGTTGGYLLELDRRVDAEYYFYTNNLLPFTFKDPDDVTDTQLASVQDYIQQTENAIFAENFDDPVNGYAKYINVDSFINWYLVKELMEDNDALDYSSIFYYRNVNGKLGMGPVWDFDLSGGNYSISLANNSKGWWVRNANWFGRLFQDPAFKAKVKARWEAMQPNLTLAINNIDQNATYLNLSQQQNFAKWDILTINLGVNSVVPGSYLGEVNYLKYWLAARIDWMNANM